MKTKELEISVVLPAYNEEDNVEQAVTTALSVLEGLFSDYEVVIVDDGSTDRTGEKADRLARLQAGRVRVYHHRVNRGYGAALRTGLFNASGKLVFYTDADNQFDLRELADFLPLIKRYDIVVGYRQQRRDALIRLFLSRGYNLLIRYLF
ncbi:MAG TPA: glycosyltransferase family 2 protein, partial [bacterium]|nr:glycosyltransferase family 2 protein [bacterium]